MSDEYCSRCRISLPLSGASATLFGDGAPPGGVGLLVEGGRPVAGRRLPPRRMERGGGAAGNGVGPPPPPREREPHRGRMPRRHDQPDEGHAAGSGKRLL